MATYSTAGGTLLWPSLPCLGCCIALQHPISTLRAVACSSGGGCCHCHQPSLVPLSLSSPVCTSLPPYEQLLMVEGSGAMGIVVSLFSLSSCHSALVVLVLVPLALALVLASSVEITCGGTTQSSVNRFPCLYWT